MKKSTIAVLLIAAALAVSQAWADDTILIGGRVWTYGTSKYYDNGVFKDRISIRGVSSTAGDVVIPSMIAGAPVMSFIREMFQNASMMTSVTIPDTISSIGEYAFWNCTSLTNVIVPASVTSIEEDSFSGCINIQHATWPGVKCRLPSDSLTTLVISEGTANIDYRAFEKYQKLTSVTIPDSVTNIGDASFFYCTNLTSVIIGSGVTDIERFSFCGCKSLPSVTIPDGVTSIGEYAFSSCESLASVNIPDNVTSIGESAFSGCSLLTDVTIPNSVTSIGDYAFSVTGLKSVVIPNSVTSIGKNAFYNVIGINTKSSLTRLTIGTGVTQSTIGEKAFYCKTLTTITQPLNLIVPGDALYIKDYDYCYYSIEDDSGKKVLRIHSLAESGFEDFDKVGETFDVVVIDAGIASIPKRAFYGFKNMTEIEIPDSVTSIDESAFDGCAGLKTVTIPDSVTAIGNAAFRNCSSLKVAYMSESLRNTLDESVFEGCAFTYSPITYKNLQGAMNTNPTTYQEGMLVTFVNPGAVTGYTFAGWQPSQITADMTGEQEITALWTAHQYSIAYNSNGGSGTMNPTAATYDTNVTIPANKFTRTGHTFKGWATSATGPVVYAAGQTVKNLTAQSGGVVTLFASWEINKHTVVIDGVQKTVNYGTEYFVSAPASYTDHAGTTQYIPLGTSAYPDRGTSFTITVLGDVSFSWDIWRTNYWLEVEIDTPGTGTVTKNGAAVAGEWIEAGTEIDLLATPVTGYEFASWYGDKNGGVEDGQTLVVQMDAPRIIGARFLDGVADPVITPADGSTFSKASQTVSITCATDGAKIYYTTNGSNPKETETNLYKGEFTITDTTTIKAKTVLGTFKSGVVAATISKVNATAPAAPLIAPADGSSFWGDSCLVTITCETPNAIIYYSTTGTNPKTTEAYRYSGPFEITETTIVKAIAKNADDDLKSSVTTATITKTVLTYEIALDASGLTFTSYGTDGEKWVVASDPSADGGVAVKSGAIKDNGSTWIETTISGTGTFSFKWRADCEDDDTTETSATWDHLRVETNGVEVARIDGVTGWLAPVSIDIVDGTTIRWTYEKDESELGGNDCVWIDTVIWTPTETIPLIADGSSAEVVNAAVDTANFADASVKAAIGGSASAYKAFKVWASGVAGGEAAVVASTNAAVSYMLGAERLFVNAPEIEFGECEVATATGEVTVSITVKDGEDAVAVASEKVKEMFEATSDLGDWNSAGKKLTPTVTDLTQGQANHLNFKVRPGDGTSPRAFLRIRK